MCARRLPGFRCVRAQILACPRSTAISPELFESGFEVFDDFLGEDVGIGEVVGFFEAFVSEPE